MKIGILTLPFNNNYGGYLQAMALTSVLERMGHEVILVNRRYTIYTSLKNNIIFTLKAIVKKCLGQDTKIIRSKQIVYAYEKKGSLMLPIVRNVIKNFTLPIYSQEDFKMLEGKNIDAYIVGSDQIWRPRYVPRVQNFYLDFLEDCYKGKRIAYAASFGTDKDEYSEDLKTECGVLIERFDAVSIREDSALNLIQSFKWNCRNLQQVLDPTMLLKADEYTKWISKKSDVTRNYVASYILDSNTEKAKMTSIISSRLNYKLLPLGTVHNGVKDSMDSWLSGIKDSQFVVTDSFHGMVFCIIFNRPFAIIVNEQRGSSRFYSLLKKFGLESRILKSKDEINTLLNDNINWRYVNEVVEKEAKTSLHFLESALS